MIALLLANWRTVGLVLLFAGFLGWVKFLQLEVTHYKNLAATQEAQIATLHAKERQLQTDADAITTRYSTSLATANSKLTKLQRDLTDRINRDLPSTGLRLPPSAVQLFNDSLGSAPDAPETKPSDASAPAQARRTWVPHANPR